MADITSKLQGNVSNEGKSNWRGDQVSVVQGGQSVYDSSTVQLAELGSRRVVGDRVFRYAKTKVAAAAGMTMQYGGETLLSLAVGGAITQPAGLKSFTITAATAIVKDTYADGYLVCEIGATDSNTGMVYGIKSQALGSSAGAAVLTLYDEIKYSVQLTSTWRAYQNLYLNVDTAAANGCPVGMSPIALTTGDFFWLQTWGPVPVFGTAAAGDGIVNSVSGKATVLAASNTPIGGAMIALAAATNKGLVFLTIAP